MNRLFRTRLAPAVFALALLPAACSDSATQPAGEPSPEGLQPGHPILASSAGIAFEVQGENLAPGSSATLRLANGQSSPIGYNLCFHDLERRQGPDWAPLALGRICTMELRTLDAGAEITYPVTLPETLNAGEYRYRAAAYLFGQNVFRDVVTGSFQVN